MRRCRRRDGQLAAARAAFAAHDWRTAHLGFIAAREESPLDADDLSALGRACWWVGLMDDSLAAWEDGYRLYLDAADNRRAAFCAFGCRHDASSS